MKNRNDSDPMKSISIPYERLHNKHYAFTVDNDSLHKNLLQPDRLADGCSIEKVEWFRKVL
jgi:hypothetical protein